MGMASARVEVRAAEFSDKEILRQLLEFQGYEHSRFDGADLDCHGRFGYRYLDHYWAEAGRYPYLIMADGAIAGMALVREGSPHSMAEFLVMPRYRRSGVGASAARLLFSLFPGRWQVREVVGDAAAVAFWRSVIPCPFTEEQDERGTIQLFTVPASPAWASAANPGVGRPAPADGVLITGVYGSGKSSVAAEIAFMLERRGEPYALLDLDYLGWGGVPGSGRASEVALMAANLAAVAANYRQAEVRRFVLAYFLRDPGELDAVRDALGVPVRVVRLTVSLDVISQRLADDVTSGRRDDLRAAAESLATGQGTGLEDLAIANNRPVAAVAQQIMDFLGWTIDADAKLTCAERSLGELGVRGPYGCEPLRGKPPVLDREAAGAHRRAEVPQWQRRDIELGPQRQVLAGEKVHRGHAVKPADFEPRDGEVGERIAEQGIFPVDHADQAAVAPQHIARPVVAVQHSGRVELLRRPRYC